MTTSELQERSSVATPSGLASVSLPMRDPVETKRFYAEVLGGELLEESSKLKFWFKDFAVILAPQQGGTTPEGKEYPHCAFSVTPDEFRDIKHRLDAYGVPTGEPWTRPQGMTRGVALMYFRDPSGNQWELFGKDGCPAFKLRNGARRGGDYTTDFAALTYKKMKSSPAPSASASPSGWNHMTLAVRNLAEIERFQTLVLGGVVTHPGPGHVTVNVGGVDIGSHETDEGWTADDAEYPHYTFNVTPEALVAMRQRLEAYGIPTHDIATHDGIDAWIYFRDPSGNLWELNCPRGFSQKKRLIATAGGDFEVDVKALTYSQWKDPGR